MKCDRCGEAFEYYDNSLCGNSIQKTLVNEKKIWFTHRLRVTRRFAFAPLAWQS